MSLQIGDRAFQGSDYLEQFDDPALLTTFRSSLKDGCVVHVVDCWFASTSTLRLRLDAIGPDIALRFHQSDVAAQPPGISLVGEAKRIGGSDQIVDVALINPLAPLLITMFDSDDVLVGADLIPFPSLCRGGIHAAELAALGPTGDPSVDLRAVGGALLVEWLTGAPSGELLAKVVVDVGAATGVETVFSTFVLAWLRGHLGVDVQLAGCELRVARDAGDESAVDHLQSQVERVSLSAPRSDNGSLLAIPANVMPTISALLTRRLWMTGEPGDSTDPLVASMLVEEVGAGIRWLVRPAVDRGNDKSFADAAYLGFPRLSAPGGRRLSPLAANMPMAIKRRWGQAAQPLTLLHPTSQDALPVVMAARQEPLGVSVLVVIDENFRGLGSLLASLAAQDYAGSIEILVHQSGSPAQVITDARSALESAFSGRYRIVPAIKVVPRGVALAHLAREATKELLLFIDDRIVLHDARSLRVLAGIAGSTTVGSASCMILDKGEGAGDLKTRSAGYLPGRLDHNAGTSDVAFVDTFDLLGPSTYAVVANSAQLLLTRRDVWLATGGFVSLFPRTRFDVDFGVRVIEAGLRNVVTTTISALCVDFRERQSSLDLHAPFFSDIARFSGAFASSLAVRRL